MKFMCFDVLQEKNDFMEKYATFKSPYELHDKLLLVTHYIF